MMNPVSSYQFTAYWCGGCHDENKITPLSQTPDYVKRVSLFCAGLKKDSTMTTEFLCRYWSKSKLQPWIRAFQERGQQVVMTIAESDAVGWNAIDPDLYAKSAKKVVFEEWKLQGIDFDVEGPNISCLKRVIPAIRKSIGENPPISFTCYTGSDEELDLLRSVKDDIDYVQTMAYFESKDAIVDLAKQYAKIVGKERVIVGVKSGTSDDSTPLETVIALAQWVKENGYGGMMLWGLDRDNPNFGDKKVFEWAETIQKIITDKKRVTSSVDRLASEIFPSAKV